MSALSPDALAAAKNAGRNRVVGLPAAPAVEPPAVEPPAGA